MVFEVADSGEDDDYYNITLSFRPQGNFDGTPGQEQFFIGKEGSIAFRQVLSLPAQTSGSGSSGGRAGGFPSWLLFGGVGAVAIAVIAVVAAMAVGGGGDGKTMQVVIPADSRTPVYTQIPTTATPQPLPPTATPQPLPSTATPQPLPPTATPQPLPPTSTPASLQTTTTFKKKNREIVFGGLDWVSALVQNGVARYIVEHGYGYPTSQIEGSTLPLFMGLRKGDIDVTMEIWLPNQDAVWNEAVKAGEVIPAGKSLEDNWQSSFLIPKYMQDANPGLDSVEDLKEDQFKSLFEREGGKVVMLGCIAGWGCRTMQDGDDTGPGQIVGMGLEDHVVLRDPGTSGSLAAAIEGAFAKKDPILFYYWGPTALALKLETEMGGIVDLEQPDPSECAYHSPIHGCAFPAAEIMIALNTELHEDAPELISFFKNWDWHAGNQLAAEEWHFYNKERLASQGKSSEEIFEATGVWYLKNSVEWQNWVPNEIAANVEAALAKE
jgi:glycine betaine/proline transport system substrate-binding protein